MIIKNFLVSDKDIVIDLLLKELCKNNISYVYLSEINELHFDKYIFRFITKDDIVKLDILSLNEIFSSIVMFEENDDNLKLENLPHNYKKYNRNDLINNNRHTNMILKKQYKVQRNFVRTTYK